MDCEVSDTAVNEKKKCVFEFGNNLILLMAGEAAQLSDAFVLIFGSLKMSTC